MLLLLMGCAGREWSTGDTAREATYLFLHTLDWGQTLYISDHDRYRERNPFLGSHPSRGKVNAFFAAGTLMHPIVSYSLPDDIRPYWQYGSIGLELGCVLNNYSLGIRTGW